MGLGIKNASDVLCRVVEDVVFFFWSLVWKGQSVFWIAPVDRCDYLGDILQGKVSVTWRELRSEDARCCSVK